MRCLVDCVERIEGRSGVLLLLVWARKVKAVPGIVEIDDPGWAAQ